MFNKLNAYNLLKDREIANINVNKRNKITKTISNFAVNDIDLKNKKLANLIAQLNSDAAETLTQIVPKDVLGE